MAASGRSTAPSAASLAAVDALTGAVDTGFVNNLSGGIGVNGGLTVQKLLLTHDGGKLVVIHTGRQINGQDRYGIGIIDTATKQLLPWRTRLWDDNLQFVGGIQRIISGSIAPDDSWFVVSSGSGGDRPPINDTVVAYPMSGGSDVQPKWISRCFDSVYTTAISEKAVYIGGHFAWNESPSAPDPFPGAADVGYGTGQGLSGYGLGDSVVGREHLGALNPEDGKALEWNPGSNSNIGNTAMALTPRGLLTGGDATTQGAHERRLGRVLRLRRRRGPERGRDHHHHARSPAGCCPPRTTSPSRAPRPRRPASARCSSSSRTAHAASGCSPTRPPGAAAANFEATVTPDQRHRGRPGRSTSTCPANIKMLARARAQGRRHRAAARGPDEGDQEVRDLQPRRRPADAWRTPPPRPRVVVNTKTFTSPAPPPTTSASPGSR